MNAKRIEVYAEDHTIFDWNTESWTTGPEKEKIIATNQYRTLLISHKVKYKLFFLSRNKQYAMSG